MKIGIVGLPNVGKSTLFNAITQAGAQSENYPFCTIEPNIGVVPVPDSRLAKLAEVYGSQKIIPTAIEFFDIAGLVQGASKGEGLGNKFLSHIREVDAIAHVVRCFKDDNIVHVDGKIDPLKDVETINLELIFADLEVIDRRIQKAAKVAKSGNKKEKHELEILEKVKTQLEAGRLISQESYDQGQWEFIESLQLLTSKPVLFIANVSEDDISGEANDSIAKLKDYAEEKGAAVIKICAKIEDEISQLDEDEKRVFLSELGLKESGLDKVIKSCYNLLGLITFLTVGPREVRAWTIVEGTKAPQAAGKIHSDFERGFIRAEVTEYEKMIDAGSDVKAKELGWTRIEGKDYVVKDGDVILFRFNV